MQSVTKAVILLITSGISFVVLFSFIIVWVVMFQPVPHKDGDNHTDWEFDSDSKFQITYNEQDGLVIAIQDDIKQTVLKGWVTIARGKEAGLRIKNCANLIGKWEEEKYLDEEGDPVEVDEFTCIELEGKAKYVVEPLPFAEREPECQSHSWTANDCRQDSFSVCFDMDDSHWYGMTHVYEQLWPLEKWVRKSEPYVTNDAFQDQYGGVQERYWVSSSGVAIYVNWEVPLWVSINETGDSALCLTSQYKHSPYQNINSSPLFMNYTLCTGLDIKHVHQFMVDRYIGKPTDIPDEILFRYPIWSTWAQYHRDINQSTVLQYANDILYFNFSNAQLEIDDRWESEYGKLDFDSNKFPDPSAMIDELSWLGFRTNLWVHPFTDIRSNTSWLNALRFVSVKDPGGLLPSLTSWWNGVATILDFTNVRTVEWYHEKLKYLRESYGVHSFKFDAGETTWLPHAYNLSNPAQNPSVYSTAFAQMAYEADSETRSQEVRIGARTQHLPMFVRMMDKVSTWGYDNGLKSIIPHALTFSLIGYPYILPDMIGGNAYGGVLPDRELYIRWVEVNVLLPGFQFSIPPWQFDEEVVDITHSMLNLRTQFAQTMIELAKECVDTGDPIVRPLWWLDPYDEVALVTDSQFLVGNDILVAPVLEPGARSRDIYLPIGSWNDNLRGCQLQGETWYLDYQVDLHELPVFTRSFNSLSAS